MNWPTTPAQMTQPQEQNWGLPQPQPNPQMFPAAQPMPLQSAAFPTAPQMDQASLDSKIMEWVKLDEHLKAVKKRELELRLEICNSHLFNSNKEKGTITAKLNGDYALKCKKTVNIKVANTNYEAANAVMQLRSLGGEAASRADRVLKFSASLSETTYRECSEAEKAILDAIITTTPGTPGLEFVAPK